jgi:hypothetical protein
MKNRNIVITGMVCALAFALAPIGQAAPRPDGGPNHQLANDSPRPDGGPARATSTVRANANSNATSTVRANANSDASDMIPEGENLPVINIYATDNVTRGKTGSFVLDMKPALAFGATYVNFKVSGTALAGVDYVALVSPAFIGQSGFGTILIKTLANPRGSGLRQAYSVVITLENGMGYFVGKSRSATIWIKE